MWACCRIVGNLAVADGPMAVAKTSAIDVGGVASDSTVADLAVAVIKPAAIPRGSVVADNAVGDRAVTSTQSAASVSAYRTSSNGPFAPDKPSPRVSTDCTVGDGAVTDVKPGAVIVTDRAVADWSLTGAEAAAGFGDVVADCAMTYRPVAQGKATAIRGRGIAADRTMADRAGALADPTPVLQGRVAANIAVACLQLGTRMTAIYASASAGVPVALIGIAAGDGETIEEGLSISAADSDHIVGVVRSAGVVQQIHDFDIRVIVAKQITGEDGFVRVWVSVFPGSAAGWEAAVETDAADEDKAGVTMARAIGVVFCAVRHIVARCDPQFNGFRNVLDLLEGILEVDVGILPG